MADIHEAGSFILPTEDNLREYLRLFESYIAGAYHGFCLLGFDDTRPVGCLLIGEESPGTLNLKTKIGTSAALWGVYIEPEYRGSHLAWTLQDTGRPLIKQLGFDSVVTMVLKGYGAAENNAFNWAGEAQQYAAMIVVPLGDTDDPRGL